MIESVPRELLPLLADRLRALADPLRLEVMALLRDGERTIGELATALGASQPTVTRQIDRLEASGWVARRRAGARVYVRLADHVSEGLCSCLCEMVRGQAADLAQRVGLPAGVRSDEA
jgi:DNA-binding transcriptional ArsR family regulator